MHVTRGSQFRYEISVEPTAETVKHLESRSKLYADERKKQQLDALDKGITEAKSKLEAAKAKAAKAKPKDPKDAKADAKAESSAEEAAVLDCERKLQAAEKAKARMEETPPELQEAPFLDKAGDRGAVCSLYFAVLLAGRCEVFDSLVAVDDISAGAALCSSAVQPFLPCLAPHLRRDPARLFGRSCGKVESQRRRHGHGEAWWHSRLR